MTLLFRRLKTLSIENQCIPARPKTRESTGTTTLPWQPAIFQARSVRIGITRKGPLGPNQEAT